MNSGLDHLICFSLLSDMTSNYKQLEENFKKNVFFNKKVQTIGLKNQTIGEKYLGEQNFLHPTHLTEIMEFVVN